MLSFWKKIPEQVKRLSIVLIVIIAGYLFISPLFIPTDFGKYGHFRVSAVEEIASQPMNYAGHEVCATCHEDVSELRSKGYHKNVACEVCHGPALLHTEDPGSGKLEAPRERGYCILCHEYLPSRPTGFPQILSESHNPMKPCITCHDPHKPEPPVTPKECSACHATIARTLSISYHIYLPCIRCHETPEKHKINPREFTPSKPTTREFCGGCHSIDAKSEKGISRIDLATHGHRYVCWQCHYPHLPEAR